ncbi:MAG: PEFG-CTERM sorting domain-containing protein [Thaumarchaeota archaeon]|nr:PEFG-CTERM sorting domain-containing protein [Nitrososphaerota archaeon]
MNFKRSSTSMAIAIMALSLISMASIQQDAFATLGMSITATADQDSDTITVTGMTALSSGAVTFQVVSPIGNLVSIDQVIPDENGNFEAIFKTPKWNEDGLYSITAKQGQSSIYTLTVLVQITSGMTVETSVTESTFETGLLDSLMIPKVTRDAGLALDAASFVNGDNRFTVTGTTDRISEAVVIQIFAPNGNLVTTAQVLATLDGEFTAEIVVGGPLWKQNGDYTVTAFQNDNPKYTASVEVEIIDGTVIPEFGTIAMMILAVAIISIIAISAKSRLSIIPRY